MNKLVLAILLICALALTVLVLESGLAIYSGPRVALLSRPPAHGTYFVVSADLSSAHGDTNALANLKKVIVRRFYNFGARIFWESLPESRVRIVTPLTAERELAVVTNLISQGGHLEFHLVHENSDELAASKLVPPGYELLSYSETAPSGRPRKEDVVVKEKPEMGLSGNIVKNASVTHDPMGQPRIHFQLNPESAAAFAEMTRTNIHHRLAIVMDGQLYSAPTIQAPIKHGDGEISGGFSAYEASLLANLMEYPLPVPVTVVESRTF